MRHPTRHQLVAYAESLVDRRAPVSAALAGHIQACRYCTQEVRNIRGSFEFTGAANRLEPSPDLTAQILLEARHARQREAQQRRWHSPLWITLQTTVCLAVLALTAFTVFGAVLEMGAPGARTARAFAVTEKDSPEIAAASLERAGDQIKRLSTAVRLEEGAAASLLEWERLRMVGALGDDIAAAKSALERNPGCVRATHIVHANIERGAQTLRDLYVEDSF